MSHHALDERHALAATLRRTDPRAPTLCGQWRADQLAAHLVLRERSIGELAGRLPIAALQRRAQQGIDALVAEWSYEQLVDAVSSGPSWSDVRGPVPVAWFWALPAVRERANILEYLVHHEDVRRTGDDWVPRELPADFVAAAWAQLRLLARVTLRSVPVGLELRRRDEEGAIRTRAARQRGTDVTVHGDAVELALFAFGRAGVSRVQIDGAERDVRAVREASIGL